MAAEWARENHSSVCIIEAVSSVWSKLFIESRVPHMANILAKLLSTLKLLKYIRPKSKVILSGVGPAALLVGKTGRILQENTQLHIVPDLILGESCQQEMSYDDFISIRIFIFRISN